MSNTETKQTQPREPIAIIGMGCRFPGGAHSPARFWELLKAGVDAIVEVPPERWNGERFYHPDPGQPGKMYVTQAGFLQQPLHAFDAAFFGISPREAERLDPQQKLLLEVTWEALEEAGLAPEQYRGSDTGVFIGAFAMDNLGEQSQAYNRNDITLHTAVSSTMTMLSNRISYTFDLHGPSFTVDTACSSSLVALHLACQALWNGECHLALCGGVNVMFRPELVIAMGKAHFLAPDGRCKTFDARADGYGRGEGAGMVVLKPLSAALAEGDRILALVRATGINQDGQTEGITLPNGDAQERLIRAVLRQAGLRPAQIQYIEAHGTGTQIGDITEAQALGRVLAGERAPDNPCWVGSVKTNIGHLEAAAGIAAVIKAVLCLQHRAIPPHLHLEQVNPELDLAALRLRVPQRLEAWPDEAPAFVAINSFGYGGTNAHVILQEGDGIESERIGRIEGEQGSRGAGEKGIEGESGRPRLVLLSGNDEEALGERVRQHLEWLEAEPEISLGDYAYTLALKRGHLPYRLAVVAGSRGELLARMAAFLEGEPAAGVIAGAGPARRGRKAAFIYTGMGAQWWGMGRELMAQEPVFRAEVEACEAVYKWYSGRSLLALFAGGDGRAMAEPLEAQPANFALQVGLTKLWAHYGLEPAAVVGHSIGEISAAYVAGVLDLEAALWLVWQRSRLQQSLAGQGGMLAAGTSLAALQPLLAAHGEVVSIAAVNSPHSVTLAGNLDSLREIATELEAREIFARFLKVEVAYHSRQMEALKAEFMETVGDLPLTPPQLPLYSTVTGRRVEAGEQNGGYWWRNCREPVQFQAALEAMVGAGYDTFIEVGPHPVLAAAIQEILHGQNVAGLAVPSLRRGEAERETMLKSLGQLHTWGQNIRWEQLYPSGRLLSLPPYPWQRTRLWAENAASLRDRLAGPDHPLLQYKRPTPEPAWESELNYYRLAYLQDHRVNRLCIMPGAASIEAMLALAAQSGLPPALEKITLANMLVLDKPALLRAQLNPANGAISLHSRPLQQEQPWTLNAQAYAIAATLPPRASRLDLEAICERCPQAVERVPFYRALALNGLEYGPAFQGIQLIHKGSQEILALIDYPDLGQAELAPYWLHPALLDAGFQACFALAEEADLPEGPYIPVAIAQLRLHARPPTRLWSYGRVLAREGQEIVMDMALCDEGGQVLVELFGVRFQAQAKKTANTLEPYLYRLSWEAAGEGWPPPAARAGAGCWLIFGDSSGLAEALASRLGQHDIQSVIIRPEAFLAPPEAAPGLDEAHLSRLQEVILESLGQQPLAAVLYLRALDLALQEDAGPSQLALTGRGELAEAGGFANPPGAGQDEPGAGQGEPGAGQGEPGVGQDEPGAGQGGPGGGQEGPGAFWEAPGFAGESFQTGIVDGVTLLGLIQALDRLGITHLRRFGIVTCGAHSLEPEARSYAPGQMVAWGLGRVLANEQPELQPVLVDLDRADPLGALEPLAALLLSSSREVQVCLRAGKPYFQRLESAPYQEEIRQAATPETACVLELGRPGILDSMEFHEIERRPPGPGEIEVQVRACALNFKDVMKAMDMLPASYLRQTFFGEKIGIEHSGVVVRVGPGVEGYRPGDAVVALEHQGGFRTYSTLPIRFVSPKPDNLSFQEAVVFINFLTAYYALHYVGRVRRGERVLIHSATGGIGLAALQVARWLGADIFTTTGTAEKREFLQQRDFRYTSDSRTLAFVDDILGWTGGEGVDVVLNSLSGEALKQGLQVLAPFGRFLEIGKRDIIENNELRLALFDRNLTFSAIDIDILAQRRPALLVQLTREVRELFEQGVFKPLPVIVYKAAEIAEAFRCMLQAKHIGKIVVEMDQAGLPVRPLARPGELIKAGRSYLVTGGYSGLGLAVAEWLAEAGARHLVLVSRSGPATAEAQAALKALAEKGVQVIAAQADISNRAEVSRLLREIEAQAPPLAGLFHSAMTLDDALLVELDRTRFEKVVRPKALGAWYLHEATRRLPLDLFVMFSSVAAVVGSPLQGNYVAANAFLDGLAHYRRSRGLPGLSINWGSISQVGVVARNPKMDQHLRRLGIQGLTPRQVLELLAYFLRQQPVQICGLNIDWRRWLSSTNVGAHGGLYRTLLQSSMDPSEGARQYSLYSKVQAAAPEKRPEIVADFLLEQISKVTRIARSHLNTEMRLNQLGLDSLMALELNSLIRLETDEEFPIGILKQTPSIQQLVELLLEKMARGREFMTASGSQTEFGNQRPLS